MTGEALPGGLRTFIRFGIVGVASNGMLYVMYLALVGLGDLQPVVAATAAWVVGVASTFIVNRSWTFGHDGPPRSAFIRYGVLYASAYLLNMALLLLLVEQAGWPHQLVQGVLVLLFGLCLFLGQRFWVFREVTP